MAKKQEEKAFEEHLRARHLKHSDQRMQILKVFLKSQRHLTAQELYRLAQKESRSIGFATVYRTLKILCDSGICRELRLQDATARYEVLGHEHHDHLICVKCGKFVEVLSPQIEKLQEEVARRHRFILQKHRLELYGTCPDCRK